MPFHPTARLLLSWCASALVALSSPSVGAQSAVEGARGQGGGPVRLQQGSSATSDGAVAPRDRESSVERGRSADRVGKSIGARDGIEDRRRSTATARHADDEATEFERYAGRLASSGRTPMPGEPEPALSRFGANMLWSAEDLAAGAEALQVPDDYVVGPGDELQIDLWGSVDASLKVSVGRGGAIVLPRIGQVQVGGVRFGELPKLLKQRTAQSFKQFDLSVSMGTLRSMRVFVTGFVQRPGVHMVPSLASLSHALAAAGGPTAIGSFRKVQLRRGGTLIETVDLYELLLRGHAAVERRLQAGDVLHVPSVGPQVAVIGSVQSPAVFELKDGETAEDLLRMAGGLNPVANRESAVVISLNPQVPVRELRWAKDGKTVLQPGEVLQVASLSGVQRASMAQAKRVRVEGEVRRPGDYLLPAGATLLDALQAAGGLTAQAFPFGAELNREALRKQQVEHYDRALRELETEFARAAVTRKERIGPPADGESPKQTSEQLRLIERLRQVQPTGRLVMRVAPDATELPALALEDGDRLLVPTRPQVVSVFGSVPNAGSFAHSAGSPLGSYLARAGGMTRGGDANQMFVLRADGSVTSNRMLDSGWWKGHALEQLPALPGDTVFVPEELDRIKLSQELKDWAQILSSFGLGAVALKNLTQ